MVYLVSIGVSRSLDFRQDDVIQNNEGTGVRSDCGSLPASGVRGGQGTQRGLHWQAPELTDLSARPSAYRFTQASMRAQNSNGFALGVCDTRSCRGGEAQRCNDDDSYKLLNSRQVFPVLLNVQ